MDAFILEKTAFESFISDISRDYSVYLPTLIKTNFDFSSDIESSVELEAGLTRQPLKRFLLPNGNPVFHFNQNRDESEDIRLIPGHDGKEMVVLGVRPCDARSIVLNAKPLLFDSSNPHSDSCFEQRWNSLVVVGLACQSPCISGFCRSVGGDPVGEEGMDLLFIDDGDSYHIKVLTAKGARLTSQKYLQPAKDEDHKQITDRVDSIRESFLLEKGPEISSAEGDINTLFSLPLWNELAERCLNCGICTHLCPTCYCFDLLDHGDKQQGCRFRVWDSCMSQLFTQQASGYNPRKSKAARIRQRFMHKLRYFPEQFDGLVACVGCGRCVRYCPVNIDIREVAKEINLNSGSKNE